MLKDSSRSEDWTLHEVLANTWKYLDLLLIENKFQMDTRQTDSSL